MNSYSQIGQDRLVIHLTKEKRCGTFVDIGCSRPSLINNTFLLENEYQWTGLSIDIDEAEKSNWEEERPDSPMVVADALKVDFLELFKEHDLPSVIDYLSFDLEPPEATFEALQRLPFDEYSFNVITFEHDGYRMGDEFKQNTRDFLSSKGYVFIHELNNQDDVYLSQEFFNQHVMEDTTNE